ncbi:MAG: hypothetical protein WCL34_12170 [Methylococcaceae bacterium]
MLTFSLTIFGGFLTFALGQVFLKLVIEPTQEFKKTLGRTSHTLLVHQIKLTNTIADENVALEIKLRSAEIASQIDVILWYPLMQKLFSLPNKSDAKKASRCLNMLYRHMLPDFRNLIKAPEISDDIFELGEIKEILKEMKEIEKLLNIEVSYNVD